MKIFVVKKQTERGILFVVLRNHCKNHVQLDRLACWHAREQIYASGKRLWMIIMIIIVIIIIIIIIIFSTRCYATVIETGKHLMLIIHHAAN